MATTLDVRLSRIMQKACLSARELALWLNRPEVTVYRWIKGSTPRHVWLDEIDRRLSVLELLAQKKEFNLVPYDLPWKERLAALKRLRDAHLPKSRAAVNRAQMRSLNRKK